MSTNPTIISGRICSPRKIALQIRPKMGMRKVTLEVFIAPTVAMR